MQPKSPIHEAEEGQEATFVAQKETTTLEDRGEQETLETFDWRLGTRGTTDERESTPPSARERKVYISP